METAERRVLMGRAAMVAAHARTLASHDPDRGSRVHPVAGGWLVLAGAGMYVNRALAAGVEGGPPGSPAEPLTVADLDLIVTESRAAGLAPEVEVSRSTLPTTIDRLRLAGFVHDPDRDVRALSRAVPGPPIDGPDDLVIRPVESPADLHLWQQVSALGWGHTSAEARQVNDAYAAAAHATPGEHMLVAFDADDEGVAGRPVGCASMTVRDGVAILGGMTTLPADRRRGVQAALLRHRAERAAELGCDLAVATAAAGSASERNLRRHGFAPLVSVETWTRPSPTRPASTD